MKQHGAQIQRKLTLLDATCIIVGTIIGSGIFETSGLVAGQVPNSQWLLWVWLAGGLISLVGSLCFAELTTAHNEAGGDYHYLSRAFDRRVGLAFAWAAFWIIRPGNIGAMAMIFAQYAAPIFSLPRSVGVQLGLALFAVVALSGLNVLGVRSGKMTQNILTVAKVLGIVLIFVAAILQPSIAQPVAGGEDANSQTFGIASFFLAMVFVMFTYGGWNDISFVAAEVKRPNRNLPRSLVLGTLVVTLCYIGFNIALTRVLGFEGLNSAGQEAPSVMIAVCAPQWGSSFAARPRVYFLPWCNQWHDFDQSKNLLRRRAGISKVCLVGQLGRSP